MTNQNESLDLGLGEPEYMQPYWDTYAVTPMAVNCRYPSLDGDEFLIEYIRKLHKQKNSPVNVTDEWEVVIGNGASQLVQAALYSYNFGRQMQVYAKPPHFARFHSFVRFSGRPLKFVNERKNIEWNTPIIEINTWPSNPEARCFDPLSKEVVYDCCYLWPQYTSLERNKLYSGSLYVFSLSKLAGIASFRIGWAFVKDKRVADLMKDFIELQSGGVSKVAQEAAATMLPFINDEMFEYASDTLKKRHIEMLAIAKKHKFKLHNHQGMYAWCEFNSKGHALEWLEKFNIVAIPGETMGGQPNYIRLNLGTSEATWQAFKERML